MIISAIRDKDGLDPDGRVRLASVSVDGVYYVGGGTLDKSSSAAMLAGPLETMNEILSAPHQPSEVDFFHPHEEKYDVRAYDRITAELIGRAGSSATSCQKVLFRHREWCLVARSAHMDAPVMLHSCRMEPPKPTESR